MLSLCLSFTKNQARYAYKRFAYKKKKQQHVVQFVNLNILITIICLQAPLQFYPILFYSIFRFELEHF